MSSLGMEIVFLKWTDPSKVLQNLATLVSMGSGIMVLLIIPENMRHSCTKQTCPTM